MKGAQAGSRGKELVVADFLLENGLEEPGDVWILISFEGNIG